MMPLSKNATWLKAVDQISEIWIQMRNAVHSCEDCSVVLTSCVWIYPDLLLMGLIERALLRLWLTSCLVTGELECG